MFNYLKEKMVMSDIIDILIDDRFKIYENDNAAAAKSLKSIEKVFNKISKKTAEDVTTNDIKQIIGALQNFSGTVKNKNALVVDGTNILDVANSLGKKVAAREKFNAEQNQQQGQQLQQQNTQQVQSSKEQNVNKEDDLKTPVTKADASAILGHLNKTKDILENKLKSQKSENVKKFLNEVIEGINEAINAAKELNGEVNNNSTPSN